MKTHTIALVLFLMSSLTLSAQYKNSFYIGATGGANLSKFKFTEGLADLYPTTNAIFGLNGGATFGFEIQDFTISSGVQYIQKGSEYITENFEDEFGVGYFTAKERLHFISVPLLFGYREYLTDRLAFSIAIGPSFNFGLGGSIDETTEYFGFEDTDVQNFKVAFGSGVNEDYRSMQVGFQVSPGLVVVLNDKNKLTFNVTWDSGVADMFNERYKDANDFFNTYKGNQLHRSTIFSVGYEHHFSFADRY